MKNTELRVLLQYAGVSRIKSKPLQAAFKALHEAGLVNESGDLTERGLAYVEALYALPLPEQRTQWVIPNEVKFELAP